MSKHQAILLVGVVFAAWSWVQYSERPTASNLRRAIIATIRI